MIWIGHWGLEQSPSSRAKCKFCDDVIKHGELRIAIPDSEYPSFRYHHWLCWADKVDQTIEYCKMGWEEAHKIEDEKLAKKLKEIYKITMKEGTARLSRRPRFRARMRIGPEGEEEKK